MDFSKTLFRSSSIGYLMTEPQSKEDKASGKLSKTAKSHLIEVYVKEKYSRQRDVETKQMKKGIYVEGDSIFLLSKYLGVGLEKNKEHLTNEYISGTPDIITADSVYDIKSSYDLWSFLPNILDKIDSQYYWQLMSYMWLTNKKKAVLAYCLVDTPDSIIESEKYYLLKRMNVVSEESPEYLKEAAKLEYNMKFGDIPLKERILLLGLEYDEEAVAKIKTKIEKAREFLLEFESLHTKFNAND